MITMIIILLESLVSRYLMLWTRMEHLTMLLDCTGILFIYLFCFGLASLLCYRTWLHWQHLYYILLSLIGYATSYNISGLDRFEARKKLWAELEETGLAVKKEPHTLRVPRSQRGGEVCYFVLLQIWNTRLHTVCWNTSAVWSFLIVLTNIVFILVFHVLIY